MQMAMHPTRQVTANAAPIPILVYHQIAQAPPKGAPFRSLCVSPERFKQQMTLLRLLGYRGLSMSELQPYLSGQLTGKVVGLTFDDGYLNNLQHALPVLAANGFSATCYAVSNMAGMTNVWDKEVGIAQVPLMTSAQMQEWIKAGQEIGAHTRHHVHLPLQSAELARDEIFGCKAELEDMLGRAVQHFCYPYGEYAQEHVEWVQEAGFTSATTTARGRCHAGHDYLTLSRVPVMRSTHWFQMWLKLQTFYEDKKRG